jgi:dCTP diphosphatase
MIMKTLTDSIRKFAQARDWEQFHNPKNLAMALGVEVAELQELLMWVEGEQSLERVGEKRKAIENEVGDILIYLLRFCDITGIDPIQAAENKMKLNAEKYPVDRSKGNSKKYTEL